MSETFDRKIIRDDAPAAEIGPSNISDRLAALLFGWPATLFFGLWCLGLLALWAPNYLSWPWFTDHDHFAVTTPSPEGDGFSEHA